MTVSGHRKLLRIVLVILLVTVLAGLVIRRLAGPTTGRVAVPASPSAVIVDGAPPPGSPYIAPIGRSPIPQPGEQLDAPLAYEPAMPPPVRYRQQPVPDSPVPWQQAGQYLGQVITVHGRIVDTHNTGEVCFLNFSRDWRGQFYLVVFAEDFERWPQPPQDYFLNRVVEVRGRVREHRGRPQIRISHPQQVRVIAP